MNYDEFKDYEQIENTDFPLARKFKKGDNVFYIEPTFYSQLMGFKEYHAEVFDKIYSALIETINKNQKLVLCGDFENPYVKLDDYIYREITDITDPLLIFAEDKSRGSDYGD